MHLAALRIDTFHNVLDHAVLAGRIHGLEDQQHRPAVLRIELLLKIGQALDSFGEQVLGFLLVDGELAGVGGIPFFDSEFVGVIDTILFCELGKAHAVPLASVIGRRGVAAD
jgi:hypothetical protein